MARSLETEGSEAAGRRFVWGPDSRLDEKGAALVRRGFLEHDPIALAQVLRGVIGEVSPLIEEPGIAARLTMPILLIAGSRDAGSLESTRRLAARLPRARVEIIEGAGHVVNLAAPAAFNAVVQDFLGEPQSGATGPSTPSSDRRRRRSKG